MSNRSSPNGQSWWANGNIITPIVWSRTLLSHPGCVRLLEWVNEGEIEESLRTSNSCCECLHMWASGKVFRASLWTVCLSTAGVVKWTGLQSAMIHSFQDGTLFLLMYLLSKGYDGLVLSCVVYVCLCQILVQIISTSKLPCTTRARTHTHKTTGDKE